MKTSPPTPKRQTETTDARERRRVEVNELLDKPLTNRALFVACGYLAEILSEIGRTSSSLGELDAGDHHDLMCVKLARSVHAATRVLDSSLDFLEMLDRSDEIARKETVKKFNNSITT